MNIFYFLILNFSLSFTLVLNDTFKDLSNWEAVDQSGQSTGNNELQYYRKDSRNIYRTMHHYGRALKLTSRYEPLGHNGYSYTSGKVISKSKVGPYGFINIRVLVPKDYGVLASLMLFPSSGENEYGPWAACGQIVMLDTKCFEQEAQSFLFFGGPYPDQVIFPGYSDRIINSIDWSVPHYFGLEWQPSYLKFWLDAQIVDGIINGLNYLTVNSSTWYSKTSEGNFFQSGAPFDVGTNIIMSLATGGDWVCGIPGCCDSIPSKSSLYIFNVEVWKQ
jgi:hypothetical protein